MEKKIYVVVKTHTDWDYIDECSTEVAAFSNIEDAKKYLYDEALGYSNEFLDYDDDEEERIRDLESMMENDNTEFHHVSEMNNFDYRISIHETKIN